MGRFCVDVKLQAVQHALTLRMPRSQRERMLNGFTSLHNLPITRMQNSKIIPTIRIIRSQFGRHLLLTNRI